MLYAGSHGDGQYFPGPIPKLRCLDHQRNAVLLVRDRRYCQALTDPETRVAAEQMRAGSPPCALRAGEVGLLFPLPCVIPAQYAALILPRLEPQRASGP